VDLDVVGVVVFNSVLTAARKWARRRSDLNLRSRWGKYFFLFFFCFFWDFSGFFWQQKSGKTELALQGWRQQAFRFWLFVQGVFFHKGSGRNCPKRISGPMHAHFFFFARDW